MLLQNNDFGLNDINFNIDDDFSLENELVNISPRILKMNAKKQYKSELRQGSLETLIPANFETDTSYHIVTGGSFNMWNWVPLIAQKNGIDELFITTWMINSQATNELIKLMDSGLIKSCKLLTGLYFRNREKVNWTKLLEYKNPNFKIKAFDNHAKVILIKNEKQNYFLSIEGSSNLTHNTRLEQNVLTNSKELYDFHKEWIDSLFK